MQVKYRREKDCYYPYFGKKKSDDGSMFYIRSGGIKSKKVFAHFR